METRSRVAIVVMSCLMLIAVLAIIGTYLFSSNESHDDKRRPNIILIMLDDLGYNDVSWNNPAVHTPNMEQLARSGVILNRNYVHSACSPSRGELLTGKYAHRLGLQNFVIQPNIPGYIPLGEKLLSERLQALGYETHLLGKWHAGHCRLDYVPTRRGFDTFYGVWNGYLDSYTKCSQSSFGNDSAYDWYDQENLDTSHQDIHVTDLIKQRALSLLQKKEHKPFFMFLSFPAPHVPIQAPKKYLEHYDHIDDTWRREYLGMITHVDEAIGEVIASLKSRGLMENTVIAMTSDNGGDLGPSSNFPLRGAKASTFEGGHRVPGFITGPRSLMKKYGYINNERFHITDWLPTFVSIADGEVDSDAEDLDGVDQNKMLMEGSQSQRREIIYHIDRTSDFPPFGYATISYDNYKLIVHSSGFIDGWEQDGTLGFAVSKDETVPTSRIKRPSDFNSPLCSGTLGLPYNFTLFGMTVQYGSTLMDRHLLFDIEADPEERTDLSDKMPEKVEELKERLHKHFQQEISPPEGVILPVSKIQRDQAWITGWC